MRSIWSRIKSALEWVGHFGNIGGLVFGLSVAFAAWWPGSRIQHKLHGYDFDPYLLWISEFGTVVFAALVLIAMALSLVLHFVRAFAHKAVRILVANMIDGVSVFRVPNLDASRIRRIRKLVKNNPDKASSLMFEEKEIDPSKVVECQTSEKFDRQHNLTPRGARPRTMSEMRSNAFEIDDRYKPVKFVPGEGRVPIRSALSGCIARVYNRARTASVVVEGEDRSYRINYRLVDSFLLGMILIVSTQQISDGVG